MGEPELHITGGAGGVDARYEDLELLARHSQELGVDLAGIAAECHAMLVNPDVLASAVLNPAGVARFEAALLTALDGPRGLGALAVELAAHSVALRAVATSYEVADLAQAELIDAIRWAGGYALGESPLLPYAAAGLSTVLIVGDALGVDWALLLTEHPGVLDNVIGAAPGLITGLPGPLFVGDVPAAARLVGLFYPDGIAHVEYLGVDQGDDTMRRPPTGFYDILNGLDYRNGQATGADQGQIDVRVVTHPDGTRAYIVDIPGTKDWHPMPFQHNELLNDLSTNVHAMGNEETAYQQGVVEALRRAGAGPTDPVMLVGHSQGGIIAAQAAEDLAGGGEFNVTHVVTAGAPVGRIDIPASVQMLALENEHDIVPHLDAADNADRANRVTVSFDSQNGSIGDNHGIGSSYLPAASALDANTDPSVVAYRNSAAVFFAGGDDTTQAAYAFQITRE